ncbi:helix-turn-helix domain-containing protein [Leifsonia poae]|uniref:Transcriptional regulator n=1 Tax=Leifsonia poae TaxID=110933 RepID=A0A9W6H9G8_9MICO|nr:helix-turn-helix transcriptional regulator [Leifsonia poae]GLJ76369.1 transcriptional regulator [Leifsonia poae]
MLLRHAIGSVLRRRRLERGTTLRQLSESSRISVPYLSEVERGRKEASSEILATLCRVLEITERELLARVAGEYAGLTDGRPAASGLRLVETPSRVESPRVGAPLRVDTPARVEAPARIVELGAREPEHRAVSGRRSTFDAQLLAA